MEVGRERGGREKTPIPLSLFATLSARSIPASVMLPCHPPPSLQRATPLILPLLWLCPPSQSLFTGFCPAGIILRITLPLPLTFDLTYLQELSSPLFIPLFILCLFKNMAWHGGKTACLQRLRGEMCSCSESVRSDSITSASVEVCAPIFHECSWRAPLSEAPLIIASEEFYLYSTSVTFGCHSYSQ